MTHRRSEAKLECRATWDRAKRALQKRRKQQLAVVGRVEDFFDAIDSDDVQRATSLMKEAKIDAFTIAIVVRKIEEADGEQ